MIVVEASDVQPLTRCVLSVAVMLLNVVRQAAVCGQSQEGGVHLGEEDSQRDVLSTERTCADLRVATLRTATSLQRNLPHLHQWQSQQSAGTNAPFSPRTGF